MYLITSREGTQKRENGKINVVFCVPVMVPVEDGFGCVGGKGFLSGRRGKINTVSAT
jgi:hypothetical protein